jgi:hypothetical protein
MLTPNTFESQADLSTALLLDPASTSAKIRPNAITRSLLHSSKTSSARNEREEVRRKQKETLTAREREEVLQRQEELGRLNNVSDDAGLDSISDSEVDAHPSVFCYEWHEDGSSPPESRHICLDESDGLSDYSPTTTTISTSVTMTTITTAIAIMTKVTQEQNSSQISSLTLVKL